MINIDSYILKENKSGELLITFESINTPEYLSTVEKINYSLQNSKLTINYIINKSINKKIEIVELDKKSKLSIIKQSYIYILEANESPFHYVIKKEES